MNILFNHYDRFLQQIQFFLITDDTFWTIYIWSLSSRFTYWKSKWTVFFRSKKLHKITKNLITKFNQVQQTMWQKLIYTDRKGLNMFQFIDNLSLIIKRFYFSSKGYFLLLWHRTINLEKWVNGYNLINNGTQHYSFLGTCLYWLKVTSATKLFFAIK